MTARQLALRFIRTFAAGDVDALAPLLSEDLEVTGPYLHTTSRAQYLSALRKDPPQSCSIRILTVTDKADSVSVSYDYVKPDRTLTIAQRFTIRDKRICEMRVLFDPAES
jgi:ketosteroid isomerase-like protein